MNFSLYHLSSQDSQHMEVEVNTTHTHNLNTAHSGPFFLITTIFSLSLASGDRRSSGTGYSLVLLGFFSLSNIPTIFYVAVSILFIAEYYSVAEVNLNCLIY